MNKLHHLSLAKDGRWRMRIRVRRDPAKVGRSLRIWLGKMSEAEAIRQRDNYMRVLSKSGEVVK